MTLTLLQNLFCSDFFLIQKQKTQYIVVILLFYHKILCLGQNVKKMNKSLFLLNNQRAWDNKSLSSQISITS